MCIACTVLVWMNGTLASSEDQPLLCHINDSFGKEFILREPGNLKPSHFAKKHFNLFSNHFQVDVFLSPSLSISFCIIQTCSLFFCCEESTKKEYKNLWRKTSHLCRLPWQNKECGMIERKLTWEHHTNIVVTELFEGERQEEVLDAFILMKQYTCSETESHSFTGSQSHKSWKEPQEITSSNPLLKQTPYSRPRGKASSLITLPGPSTQILQAVHRPLTQWSSCSDFYFMLFFDSWLTRQLRATLGMLCLGTGNGAVTALSTAVLIPGKGLSVDSFAFPTLASPSAKNWACFSITHSYLFQIICNAFPFKDPFVLQEPHEAVAMDRRGTPSESNDVEEGGTQNLHKRPRETLPMHDSPPPGGSIGDGWHRPHAARELLGSVRGTRQDVTHAARL